MVRLASLLAVSAGLVAASCAHETHNHSSPSVPSVDVPCCPRLGTIVFSESVPDRGAFPETQVDLCHSDEHIRIQFTARDEAHFFFNASQGTNDDIWAYEVMEAFIYHGSDDPKTYLEFEVNPNNVTYQAFVYNPSKDRAQGEPFDHLFVSDPATDGFRADTTLFRGNKVWKSNVEIPLGLFNIDKGQAQGTRWRMNFFRTVVSPQTFPEQQLGAWSVPDKASFHITRFFGRVNFV